MAGRAKADLRCAGHERQHCAESAHCQLGYTGRGARAQPAQSRPSARVNRFPGPVIRGCCSESDPAASTGPARICSRGCFTRPRRSRSADEIEVNLGALDAPDQLLPTYELWTIRRESWLPSFPLAGDTSEIATMRVAMRSKALPTPIGRWKPAIRYFGPAILERQARSRFTDLYAPIVIRFDAAPL